MLKNLLLIALVTLGVSVNAQQTYYDDVDLTKRRMNLFNELASKTISTHTKNLTYRKVWDACKATDENPDNPSEVLLIYGYSNSGKTARTRSKNSNGGNSSDWNREHTYAKSLGNPNLGTSGPGADAHHLRPSDVGFNSQRSNKKFAAGSGNAGNSNNGWYPGDEWKGDIARMMMYMYLRYGTRCYPTGVTKGSKNSVDSHMVNILLEWNAQDPPSEVEKQRNTYHNSSKQYAQGNRNPFIDNPYLATLIWGGQDAKDNWNMGGSNTPVTINPPSNITVTPNGKTAKVTWTASTTSGVTYKLNIEGGASDTSNNTEYTFNGMTNGNYKVFVYAIDANNNTSTKISTSFVINSGGSTNPTGPSTECGKEDFENIGTSISGYDTRKWNGNKTNWTATKARTDLEIDDKSICLGKGDNSLTSETINGGISSFTVTTKRFYSGSSGSYKLYINNNIVGEIPYSNNEKTTTISDINVTGDFKISIKDNSSFNNRVGFDNISWTCYDATSGIEDIKGYNNINIFPNPSKDGNFIVLISSGVKVTKYTVYSVLGDTIKSEINPNLSNGMLKIENLKSGIYILNIEEAGKSITKKLIVE